MNAWLPEQLKTCQNLLATCVILINTGHEELLPTQLELLLELCQQMVDENCVADDGQDH